MSKQSKVFARYEWQLTLPRPVVSVVANAQKCLAVDLSLSKCRPITVVPQGFLYFFEAALLLRCPPFGDGWRLVFLRLQQLVRHLLSGYL